MWKLIPILAFGCVPTIAPGQPANTAPAQITIKAAAAVLVAGAPINVIVELRNVSDHPIQSDRNFANGVEATYGFRVKDGNGSTLEATLPAEGGLIMGKTITTTLQAGQSSGAGSVCLSCMYRDLAAPGKYRVYASRILWSNGVMITAKSNEIEINVLPKN